MIRQCRTPERREFLTGITAISAVTIVSSTLQNQALARVLSTPAQTEGPFYPVRKPPDQDADLTMVGNNGERAAGDLLLVQGRVLTPNDSPVANALVEIWQTNAWGRYQDHRDRSDVPWDQNFRATATSLQILTVHMHSAPSGQPDTDRAISAEHRIFTSVYQDAILTGLLPRCILLVNQKTPMTAR